MFLCRRSRNRRSNSFLRVVARSFAIRSSTVLGSGELRTSILPLAATPVNVSLRNWGHPEQYVLHGKISRRSTTSRLMTLRIFRWSLGARPVAARITARIPWCTA
jgi:hypothetical protein